MSDKEITNAVCTKCSTELFKVPIVGDLVRFTCRCGFDWLIDRIKMTAQRVR